METNGLVRKSDSNGGQRRLDRGAVVGGENGPPPQEVREPGELRVMDVARADPGHHQPHFVTLEATRLRRLVRRQLVRQLELNEILEDVGAHAALACASASTGPSNAAVYRPLG